MRTKLLYITGLIMALAIGAGSMWYVADLTKEETTKIVKDVTVTEADTIKESIDKVYDSVVLLESYRAGRLVGSGTGFVYKINDTDAYIITNHHVIDNSDEVKMTNSKKGEFKVTILGSDEMSDLAVLSVPKEGALKIAEIGKSDQVELGDTVFTVGSPLGKQYMGTVTKGILSGKSRTISVQLTNGSFIMEVLQTDAAINPGNSGGPLLNINGEVIGVNSLKLVEDEIEGMGFAIPVEIVMGAVDRLEKGEKIIRPLLGIEMLDVSNTYLLYLEGIFLNSEVKEGVVVVSTEKGSPAEKAGIQKNDIIVELDGVKVADTAHLRYNLYKHSVGDKVQIKYFRDKELKETTVTLDKGL